MRILILSIFLFVLSGGVDAATEINQDKIDNPKEAALKELDQMPNRDEITLPDRSKELNHPHQRKINKELTPESTIKNKN